MKFKTGMTVSKKGEGVLGTILSTLSNGMVEVEWDKATRYQNHPLVNSEEPQTLWEQPDNLVDVSPTN